MILLFHTTNTLTLHSDKLGGTGQPIMKIFYPCYITACSIALLNWQNKSGSRARRHSAVLVPGAALLATLHCDASPFKMDNEFSSAYQQSNKPINTIYCCVVWCSEYSTDTEFCRRTTIWSGSSGRRSSKWCCPRASMTSSPPSSRRSRTRRRTSE